MCSARLRRERFKLKVSGASESRLAMLIWGRKTRWTMVRRRQNQKAVGRGPYSLGQGESLSNL